MDFRDYITQVGLQNISKEQLVYKIEELYTLLDSNRCGALKVIEDRDNKILELLEERNQYKEYYYTAKEIFDKLITEIKTFNEKRVQQQNSATTEVMLSTCKNSFYNILCLQIHKPTAICSIQLGNVEYYSDVGDFGVEELSTAYLVSRDSFPIFKINKETHEVTDYRK